ncbi:unnamed protein product [Caenorhabditis sp. 36 PRJEB53466]|nr:unnamed protein product [Caenorhabditis sp. 36 PRJEB53466]
MENARVPWQQNRNILLPYVVKYSDPSKYLRCSNCHEVLMTVQLGIWVTSQDYPNWYHQDCFWSYIGQGNHQISIDLVYGIDTIRKSDQKLLLEKMSEYERKKRTCALGTQYFASAVGKNAETSEVALPEKFTLLMDKLRIEQTKQTRPINVKSIGSKINDMVVLSTSSIFEWNQGDNEDSKCSLCANKFENKAVVLSHNCGYTHSRCLFTHGATIFDPLKSAIGWDNLPTEVQMKVMLEFNLALLTSETKAMTFRSSVAAENANRKRAGGTLSDESENATKSVGTLVMDTPLDDTASQSQGDLLHAHRTCFSELSEDSIKVILNNKQQSLKSDSDLVERLVDITVLGTPLPCPKCNGILSWMTSRRSYVCHGHITQFTLCGFSTKNPDRKPIVLYNQFAPKKTSQGLRSEIFRKRLYVEDGKDEVLHGIPVAPHELTKLATLEEECRIIAKNPYSTKKYLLKDGFGVPSDFLHADRYNLLRDDDGTPYEANLMNVEVQINCNSNIKLSILKHDLESQYVVIETLSRMGTKLSKNQKKNFTDRNDAILSFTVTFFCLTRNLWENRKAFKKIADAFFYIQPKINCHCPERSAHLTTERPNLRKIGEIEYLQENISDKQKTKAANVLQNLMNKILSGTVCDMDLIDATNRFYSMLPTCTGFDPLQILPNDVSKLMKMKAEISSADTSANCKCLNTKTAVKSPTAGNASKTDRTNTSEAPPNRDAKGVRHEHDAAVPAKIARRHSPVRPSLKSKVRKPEQDGAEPRATDTKTGGTEPKDDN